MRVLIFGSGLMAKPIAYDLIRQEDVERVYLIDVNARRLKELRRWLNSPKVKVYQMDATDKRILPLLGECGVAISCVPYEYNLKLTRLAIAAKTNFCDLGGNNTIVRRQLALSPLAEEAGITVIPDCGLAPGMTNILAADGFNRLDKTEAVHIRVGGLPRNPKPPFFYRLLFSGQGLLNEYAEPCLILRDGRVKRVKPLTEPEEISFPKPFSQLEAFHTSGGSSTLPETFQGKVKSLDYKTIRYPFHRVIFQLLLKAAVGDWQRYPRAILGYALEKTLGFETDDVVLLRVDVMGKKGKERKMVRYQLIDYADSKIGLTAMMRTTGFSAAIVALMLAREEIEAKGVLPQERVINTSLFINEIKRRGLKLTIRSRSAPFAKKLVLY
ncbi:MAG: saccharopine dehydrogenase C-terminal domain-containing protein [candidate division WOR-3 bacterium]